MSPTVGNRVPVVTWLAALTLTAGSVAFADPPASVTYTYDDAGRLRDGTFSDGKQVGYQYDAAGNRTAMTQGLPVQLSIAAASATEGSALAFTVTKSGTASGTVTVQCTQVDGSAIAPGDYTLALQTLTFLLVDTTKTCSVASVQDALYEQNQTFNAVLQNPTGVATIATGSAIGTIVDNDAAPTLTVTNATIAEGGTLVFTVTKTGATELAHNVNYASADGTATVADSDYGATSGTVAFTAAQTTAAVNVATTTDAKYESNETLTLTLSGPTNGAVLGTPSQGTGAINNDDAAPSFAINDPAILNEGQPVVFTITKTGSTALSHGLNWASANGTATTPADYTAASGVVTFLPTDTQLNVSVTTILDGVTDGGSETLFVNLTTNASSNGATIADAQGSGTIMDMEAAPSTPANFARNPASGTVFGGSFSLTWSASSGPVNDYRVEESLDSGVTWPNTYVTTSLLKQFNKGQVDQAFKYRVKACSVSMQCSAPSGILTVRVCPSSGCP